MRALADLHRLLAAADEIVNMLSYARRLRDDKVKAAPCLLPMSSNSEDGCVSVTRAEMQDALLTIAAQRAVALRADDIDMTDIFSSYGYLPAYKSAIL